MKQVTIVIALILCVWSSIQAQTTESMTEPSPTVVSPTSVVKFQTGVRYWHGTSKYQLDLIPRNLVSRLTAENMNSQSVEIFTRLDVSHFFLKGTVGLGVSSGRFYDEDWKLPGQFGTIEHSNTLSEIANGVINDATIDAGIAVGTKDRKIGLFLGYNYFGQRFDIYGCAQLIDPNGNPYCGSITPTDRLVSTMDTRWNSIRGGAVAEIKLPKHFKISGEIALAGTKLAARDNHLLRSSTTWFDSYGYGYGLQFEATAGYIINGHLSVNGGWRYWSLKAFGGNDYCTSFGCKENGSERLMAKRNGLVVGVIGIF